MLIFEISGMKEVQKTLNNMAKRRRDGKYLSQVSKIVERSIDKNYAAEGRPKWTPRKKKYSHPILDKTGRKRDTEQMSARAAWVLQGSEFVLEIYSTIYGKYHQEGCGRLPVRKSVALQTDEILKIREILQQG